MASNVSNYSDGIQFVENLLHQNDLKGAIDFAKRVKTSSLKLKRLSQFLASIVVQVSGEDEETDWYTVLGVDPSADLKTMKIRYVQQVKQIRQIGSFEAYKILDKAWKTLSDKFTRKDFDLRRRSRELQENPLAERQESSATENVSHGLENVNNIVVSDQREISATDCDGIWNSQNTSHEQLGIYLVECPGCQYKSYRDSVFSKADCPRCGKEFADIELPYSDAEHEEEESLIQDSGDTIKNVPENYLADWADGQTGINTCQMGNFGAEMVVSSEGIDGNGKMFSDLERNISTDQTERNAVATDQTERNAAATEGLGLEEDGLKTMEVPDSLFDEFERDWQEYEKKYLNARKAEWSEFTAVKPSMYELHLGCLKVDNLTL